MGNKVYETGTSPFVIEPYVLSAFTENDGLPTFGLIVEGITDSTPYFYLDFSNSNSVAWGSACTYTNIGTYASGDCSD